MVKANEKKLQSARLGFNAKTNRFREYLELPSSVYEQLEDFGVIVQRSFLLQWFPEDTNVFTVRLILSNGKSHSFCIATDDPDSFSYRDTTTAFMESVRKNKQKPWMSDIIAWEAYTLENS